MLEILNTSRVSKNRVNRIDRLIFSYYDKEEINNFNGVMFGLIEKIFGEDYYTVKKSIYRELEGLAKQIGEYLELSRRMIYLQ